eukprot:Phypoly_transcript_25907.p1 GENE.Phypoly_transcript_25907~~Phypoly_transcript_25907.p1  ORF type:complete len:100 (+),score=6.07 Phypoly_transcript_25907:139-438(+)
MRATLRYEAIAMGLYVAFIHVFYARRKIWIYDWLAPKSSRAPVYYCGIVAVVVTFYYCVFGCSRLRDRVGKWRARKRALAEDSSKMSDASEMEDRIVQI